MDRLNEELRMAGKSSEVLNNEAFSSAVNALEQAILLGIRQSAFKDTALREKLCDRYCTLHEILGQLQTHIDTGELAKEEIRRKTLLEKAKEFIG